MRFSWIEIFLRATTLWDRFITASMVLVKYIARYARYKIRNKEKIQNCATITRSEFKSLR